MTPGIIGRIPLYHECYIAHLPGNYESSCHPEGKINFRTCCLELWSSKCKYITKVRSQTYMVISKLTYFYLWKSCMFSLVCGVCWNLGPWHLRCIDLFSIFPTNDPLFLTIKNFLGDHVLLISDFFLLLHNTCT